MKNQNNELNTRANQKLKKSKGISIRIYDRDLLAKYQIWASQFKTKNKNHDTNQNEELCNFLEQYLDGQITSTMYKLFAEQINEFLTKEHNTINELIFKRNFGLVNFLTIFLKQICVNIEMLNIKLNWIINSLNDKKVLSTHPTIRTPYCLTEELKWMTELRDKALLKIEEELERVKLQAQQKDRQKIKGKISDEN